MNKLLLLFNMLYFALTANAAETNFSFGEMKIKQGETKSIPVFLINDQDVKGLSIDITLPDGLSFVSGDIVNTGRVPSGFTQSGKIQTTGTLRVAGLGLGQYIEVGDGEIFSFQVKADENVTLGNANIHLSAMKISLTSGNVTIAERDENIKIYTEYLVDATSADETMGSVTGGGTFENGTTATLMATPIEGYHFVNWSDEKTDNPYVLTVNAETTLTATFAPNKYTAMFVLGNGEEDVVKEQDYKSELTAPTGFTHKGYNFSGWDKDIPAAMPIDGGTYTATWTPVSYTISYDLAGGVLVGGVTNATEYTIESDAITVSNPTREGYTFAGWTGTGLTEATTTLAIAKGSTGNREYTAQWEQKVIVLDETSTMAPATSEANVKVTVKRVIKANEWSTICLPFGMTAEQVKAAFGNNVQLGDFAGYEVQENGSVINVKFNPATSIEANHPYIIKVLDNVSQFEVSDVKVDPTVAPQINLGTAEALKAFTGNYVNGTTLVSGSLFLYNDRFWYSVGQTKIQAYRAYFNFADLLPSFMNNEVPARVYVTIEGETTLISDELRVKSEEGLARWPEGESQFATAWIYDLQGRKIENSKFVNSELPKGIYIVNGKKVFNK